MRRPLALLLVLGSLSACGPAGTPTFGSASSAQSAPLSAPEYRVHRDVDKGFVIGVPPRWRIRQDALVTTPQGERTGTAFVFPLTEASGTSLLGAQVHVSLSPNACPRIANGKTAVVGAKTFMRVDWSSKAAGTLQEGSSYSLDGPKGCGIVTLAVRTCIQGPDCGPENQGPFNAADLRATAERMLSTFALL